MPDITLPHTATAGPANPTEFRENLFVPKSSPDSLAVINGFITKENLAPELASEIPRNLIRPRTFNAPQSVGATGNLDYFLDHFYGDWNEKSWVEAREKAITVPSASRRFSIPWDDCTAVYISFRIELVPEGPYYYSLDKPGGLPSDRQAYGYYDTTDISDSSGYTLLAHMPPAGATVEPGLYQYGDTPGETRLMLFYDGEPVKGVGRIFADGMIGLARPFNISSNSGEPLENYNYGPQPYSRHWSCAAIIDANGPYGDGPFALSTDAEEQLSRGLHNVSLRLSHKLPHVRIRTRHMTVIPLR